MPIFDSLEFCHRSFLMVDWLSTSLLTILIDRPTDSRASPSGEFVPGEIFSYERRVFIGPSLSGLLTRSVRTISSLSCIELSYDLLLRRSVSLRSLLATLGLAARSLLEPVLAFLVRNLAAVTYCLLLRVQISTNSVIRCYLTQSVSSSPETFDTKMSRTFFFSPRLSTRPRLRIGTFSSIRDGLRFGSTSSGSS
jgi:hypothetical protein